VEKEKNLSKNRSKNHARKYRMARSPQRAARVELGASATVRRATIEVPSPLALQAACRQQRVHSCDHC
jgi:hypothetical protein